MIPIPFSPIAMQSLPYDEGHTPESGLPIVVQLPASFSLPSAFERFQALPGVLWLDSVTHPTPTLGRYSFLTADPIEQYQGDDCRFLRKWLHQLPATPLAELPPFQGGVAGLLSYEWAGSLEKIAPPRFQELTIPQLSLGFYDWTIATDHSTNSSWLISQGFGAGSGDQRRQTAAARVEQVLQWLAGPAWPSPGVTFAPPSTLCSPQFSTGRHSLLTSNFSPTGYRNAVAEIVRSIRAGDSFQVNLSQRLLFPARGNAADLYMRLRRENPAPEAAYYNGGSFQILSSSPETFLRVRNRRVETRPIKGTCRRSGDPRFDAELAEELYRSDKDRAENVMIVDLMRNDLSRVCTDRSVRVAQLCQVEPYAYVQHLVSVVNGELRPECDLLDLLQACFPGGSVTGAPKVEAMQKIVELEQVPRGAYCGSIGYVSSGQTADFNILIRTITQSQGFLQIPVGGGITAASDPFAEERETWHKAEGLLRALPI